MRHLTTVRNFIIASVILFCGVGGLWLGQRPPEEIRGAQTSLGPGLTTAEQVEFARSNPPRLAVEVTPSSGKVKPYQRIRCRVRVTIPAGGVGPSWVYAIVRAQKGKGDYVHDPLEVKGHDGDAHVLEKTIFAPSRPGKYQLFFEEEYDVSTNARDLPAGTRPPAKSEPVRRVTPALDLEVRR